MSDSFSADWLALREPVDHRSINASVRDALVAWVGNRSHLEIVDLGCGSGSNLRSLSPQLPKSQHWRLVDHDEALLDHAEIAISAWSDEFASDGDRLSVRKLGRKLTVDFVQADLAAEPASVLEAPLDLVTSAAFFDLVSETWIEMFCRELATRKLPLYAVLTYDGTETWAPPHAADAQVLDAFHAHQRRDKGFGPAAGPQAAHILQRVLEHNGYTVSAGDSAWRLGTTDQALTAILAQGSAQAALETETMPADTIEAWRTARMQSATCQIGHIDLFARPA